MGDASKSFGSPVFFGSLWALVAMVWLAIAFPAQIRSDAISGEIALAQMSARGFAIAVVLAFAGRAYAQVVDDSAAPPPATSELDAKPQSEPTAPVKAAASQAATPTEPPPEGDSPLARAAQEAAREAPLPPPLPIEGSLLHWDPQWARVGPINYTVIGVAAATAITSTIFRPLGNHNLEEPILFDEEARRRLRLPSLNARYTARDISDVLLSLETTWPFAIDALVLASGVHRSPDVAWEMAVIDAEVLAVTTAVHQLTANLVSRPRPYLQTCGTELRSELNDCVRNGRYRSFFSGHSATSFAGASLVCAHRARLELFGPKADVATCITAYAAAAATATLRVAGDVHNASDVIVGAIVGTAIGLGIPALHYHKKDRGRGAKVSKLNYDVSVYPTGTGLGLAVVY